MSKSNQPHDKYFKSTFGKVGFAKDFLSNYLPEELVNMIDMNTLSPQPIIHISKELKEQFTDLLFRVNILNKEAYVYFLFEHKSYRDRMVIFQILKYMIAVWEAKIKEDLDARKEDNIIDTGDIEIPIVIPLVVYHDKHKWNIKRTLGDMIPNYKNLPDSVKKYVPDFEYLLSDLSNPDQDIDLDEEHSIVIRTLNKSRYAGKDEIIDIFTQVINLFMKNKNEDMIKHYIIETIMYIFSSRNDFTKEELFEIAGQISDEGGELVMTLAEKLKREGMKEGKEEGVREATLDSALTLLEMKFGAMPEDIIKRISQQDITTLKLIISNIFKIGSLNDIEKHLK